MVRFLRYNIATRPAALLGADIIILLIAASVLAGYAITPAVDGRYSASSTLSILISAAIGLGAIILYRWDFWSDRRSWALRAIIAFILLTTILVSSDFYVDHLRAVARKSNLYIYLIPIALLAVIYLIQSGARLFQHRILLIGGGKKGTNIEDLVRRSGGAMTVVRRVAGAEGWECERALGQLTIDMLRRERVTEIVVAVDEQRGLRMDRLLEWKFAGFRVTDYLTFWERECGRVDLGVVSPAWLVYGNGCRRGVTSELLKRTFDVTVALLLLALTLPLLGLCAALIWLESGGPILYRQERVGRYGRSFNLLKLRSMYTNAERAGVPQWARTNDPRTTRVGRVLRRLRIDEIPQLWNVLRSDMSLIGPRPERPHFVDQLAAEIPLYRERHWIKPGITGWAQINFSYGASISDARQKLSYDLYYVKNASLLLDMFIAMATMRVILFQEGAR